MCLICVMAVFSFTCFSFVTTIRNTLGFGKFGIFVTGVRAQITGNRALVEIPGHPIRRADFGVKRLVASVKTLLLLGVVSLSVRRGWYAGVRNKG